MKTRVMIWLSMVLVFPTAVAQSRFTYSIPLTGANVRPLPSTPSLATGSADIVVDIFPSFTTIGWKVRWANLSELPMSANLHGPSGSDQAGPAFFSLGNFFSDSTPVSGTYSGFRQVSDELQIAAIHSGMSYVSLRTAAYPGGEIRGQLLAVPEPSVLVLAVGGAFVLWLHRGSRTKQTAR